MAADLNSIFASLFSTLFTGDTKAQRDNLLSDTQSSGLFPSLSVDREVLSPRRPKGRGKRDTILNGADGLGP